MRWFLLAFLGSAGVIITGLCVLFLLLRGRFRRVHRVEPKTPTAAPVTWVVDPRSPARLHRRLTQVGRTAQAVVEEHRPATRKERKALAAVDRPQVAALAEDLIAQAVALDQQVTRVAHLHAKARRAPLAALDRQIRELEQTAANLIRVAAQAQAPALLSNEADDLFDVSRQVAHLAEAQAALADLDAEVGLVPPPHHQPTPVPPAQAEPTARTWPPRARG